RGLGGINVRIIPNCIDVSDDQSAWNGEQLARWLFVGWVIPSKGIPELLDALAHFPDARLTIVGPVLAPTVERDGGSSRENIVAESLRARISYVDNKGMTAVREMYRHHDLFVFPSRREGFPNAVLE